MMPNSNMARQPFDQAYKMGALLGKGGFGTVYAGERIKDTLPVAIKVIKKAKITQWCKVVNLHNVALANRSSSWTLFIWPRKLIYFYF